MLKIPRSYTIIHPRTVMVHPTDTPIAYPTVVRKRRLKGLTLRTHSERLVRIQPPNRLDRLRRNRHRAGIRKLRLRVAGQGEGAEHDVDHGEEGVYPPRLRQERNGDGAVAEQEPDHAAHDGSGGVGPVHPGAVLFGGADGAGCGLVVEVVAVVVSVGAFLGEHLVVGASGGL